jgi:hypothetical protein
VTKTGKTRTRPPEGEPPPKAPPPEFLLRQERLVAGNALTKNVPREDHSAWS